MSKKKSNVATECSEWKIPRINVAKLRVGKDGIIVYDEDYSSYSEIANGFILRIRYERNSCWYGCRSLLRNRNKMEVVYFENKDEASYFADVISEMYESVESVEVCRRGDCGESFVPRSRICGSYPSRCSSREWWKSYLDFHVKGKDTFLHWVGGISTYARFGIKYRNIYKFQANVVPNGVSAGDRVALFEYRQDAENYARFVQQRSDMVFAKVICVVEKPIRQCWRCHSCCCCCMEDC